MFKKIILVLICGMHPAVLFSQTNTFPSTGNVGIGTVSPTALLEMSGGTGWTSNNWKKSIKLNVGQAIQLSSGIANFGIGSTSGNTLYFFSTPVNDTSQPSQYIMVMKESGNVGIGTLNPGEKLSVNGNIRAKEMKVEVTNWPDYVFAKNYRLPSLQETEKQIKEKGHLPGIPSAEEVKVNGIDLGDINTMLLRKLEEVTLHLIVQEKRLNEQEKLIKKLTKKLK